MKAGAWYEENLHEDMRSLFLMEEVLHHTQSAHQAVTLFYNKTLGRALAIDNILQSCERDEHIYHEMLVHPALLACEEARDILIIGGGDGGAAREVLKHPVRSLSMVDIDAAVVDLCKEYLPHHNAGAFEDARFTLTISDGAHYVKTCTRTFDCIIIDSTDCVGAGAVLFSADFYQNCWRCLRAGGVMVNQNGIPFLQPEELRAWMRHAVSLAPYGGFYCAAVPFYVGGVMGFGWASSSNALATLSPEEMDTRIKARKIDLRYYSGAVHHAARNTPSGLEQEKSHE